MKASMGHDSSSVPFIELQERDAPCHRSSEHPPAASTRPHPEPGAFTDVEYLNTTSASMEAWQQHRGASDLDHDFEAWLNTMGFSQALLEAYEIDRRELHSLYQRDTMRSHLSCLPRYWLRPRSIEYMPERLWLALTMRPGWVSRALANRSCWDPRDWIWVRGIAIPMVNTRGYALKLLMSNLWRGSVSGFKLTLHGILLISLGIQLQKVLDEQPEDIWSTLRSGDSETWKRLIYDATGTSARLFWPLIFAPTLIMTFSQMTIQTTRTLARGRGKLIHLTSQLLQKLEEPTFWSSWLRPLLPLDQLSFQLANVSDQLTFDGRAQLTPRYRVQTIRYLVSAIRQTRGLHRLLSLRLLADLSMGTHIQNLMHYQREKELFTAATPLSHLAIRLEATRMLESCIHTQSNKPEARLYREWARYHAWMAGRSTPWMLSVLYLSIHLSLMGYFFYGFKVIVEAIQAYLDCPDKTGVSMTGVADWSNDYTQPCFDAYVSFFRKIPGQPLSFLLDIIDRVHFTQTAIPLDLSYKGVNGSEISSILQALARRGVSIVSLDLTGNFIATAEDYHTLMPLLAQSPNFERLVLNHVGLESGSSPGANASGTTAVAHWLPRLTSLKSLSIEGRRIGMLNNVGISAIARALAACTSLQAITLTGEQLGASGASGLIQLAASLTQLPSLKYFAMSEFWLEDATAFGLARSFVKLKQLEHLQMRYIFNWATAEGTAALLNAFSGMQSLKILDLTNSMLGVRGYLSFIPLGDLPMRALANTTTALHGLQALQLNHTFLGYEDVNGSLALVHALRARRQPLTKLELAFNPFSKAPAHELDMLLMQWDLPRMPLILNTVEQTQRYLASIPPSQTYLSIEYGPQNDETLSALLRGIANSSITRLDINGINFRPLAQTFGHLAHATQLEHFGFSHPSGTRTAFALSSATWLSLLNAVGQLKRLKSFSLAQHEMFWLGGHDLARGLIATLKQLEQLEDINLFSISMGVSDIATMIFQALSEQPRLKNLNLGDNYLGWDLSNASAELIARLPRFSMLQSLDVSQSRLGFHEQNSERLAEYLASITKPFYLNASQTAIGTHPRGATALMYAIANNPYISVSMVGSGFGSQLWPPQFARIASKTYDPFLKAACSNLQCFGVQPTLPDLGNNTRINFKEDQPLTSLMPQPPTSTRGDLLVVTLLALMLCAGLGYLLACLKRPRPSASDLEPQPQAPWRSRPTQPVMASSLKSKQVTAHEKERRTAMSLSLSAPQGR